MKVHALSLNAPSVSSMDTMAFVGFIKRMRKVKDVHNYSPRVMYRILKTYYPNLVRKTYRTYFTSNFGGFAMISTGLLTDESLITDYERSAFNKNLYTQGLQMPTAKVINHQTGTAYKPPPAAPVYVAPKKEVTNTPQDIQVSKAEAQKTPTDQQDDSFSVYGEE